MTTPFLHTTRSIQAAAPRKLAIAAATGAALLLAWGAWCFNAEITIYKTSSRAALRQVQNTIQLSAPRAGRITAIHATLGQAVARGDSLLQFDTRALDLDVSGDTRLAQSIGKQIENTGRERKLRDAKFQREQKAQQKQLALLRDKLRLQKNNLEIQENITQRYASLLERQQSAQLDYLTAKRSQQQMAMQTLQLEADISAAEERLAALASDYRQALIDLEQRRSAAEQQLVQADTRVQQQTLAVDEYQLRAPIAGKLAALADISVGQRLEAGASIGSIQAPGQLRIRAQFSPAAALGHIRPGQRARVRLDGFAWTRYGEIPARVENIATAVQNGTIAVQLAVDGEIPPGLPLLHDLPASVEVATGRKTPFELLLQRAGDWLQGEQGTVHADPTP